MEGQAAEQLEDVAVMYEETKESMEEAEQEEVQVPPPNFVGDLPQNRIDTGIDLIAFAQSYLDRWDEFANVA